VSQLVLTNSLETETGGFEFTLNYLQPERNHGFFAMRVMNVVVGDERMDAIVIIKPLYDPRDAKEETMFNAKLLPNRTGIEVTEPSLPFYLQNSIKDVNNAEKHFLKSNAGGSICKATALEYKTQAVDFSQSEYRRTKTTILRFPYNIKGCNDYLNNNDTKKSKHAHKYNLHTHRRFVPQQIPLGKTQEIAWCGSYVYWKIVINGTVRSTEVEKTVDSDELFEKAWKSMNI
jgi:hypothetical protein